MQIVWSRTAQADLNAIFEYLFPKNASAAIETIGHIYDSAAHLADHPEIGRSGRVEQTRELIVPQTPYIVSYRIKAPQIQMPQIQILTVIHGRRKWPDSFQTVD